MPHQPLPHVGVGWGRCGVWSVCEIGYQLLMLLTHQFSTPQWCRKSVDTAKQSLSLTDIFDKPFNWMGNIVWNDRHHTAIVISFWYVYSMMLSRNSLIWHYMVVNVADVSYSSNSKRTTNPFSYDLYSDSHDRLSGHYSDKHKLTCNLCNVRVITHSLLS